MAITLEANYAKRLGLPGYSSHQFSVTVRTELSDLSQVEQESQRLYRLLQDAVDEEIQQVGFVPDAAYGISGNGNGNTGSTSHNSGPGENRSSRSGNGNDGQQSASNGAWRCSDKQREFIERIVSEKHLDKNEVEALAQQMFGAGVRQLNRLEASGLIDELLERHGSGNGSRRRNGGNGNSGGSGSGNGYHRARERRFERSAASAAQGGGGGE